MAQLLLFVALFIYYLIESASAGTLPESSQSTATSVPSSTSTSVVSANTAAPNVVSYTASSGDPPKSHVLSVVFSIVLALVVVAAILPFVLGCRKQRKAREREMRENLMARDGLAGDGLRVEGGGIYQMLR